MVQLVRLRCGFRWITISRDDQRRRLHPAELAEGRLAPPQLVIIPGLFALVETLCPHGSPGGAKQGDVVPDPGARAGRTEEIGAADQTFGETAAAAVAHQADPRAIGPAADNEALGAANHVL